MGQPVAQSRHARGVPRAPPLSCAVCRPALLPASSGSGAHCAAPDVPGQSVYPRLGVGRQRSS
jgi:hypothetical protein